MKHIRLYLITLFIACSMFMLCPFAFAEEMPSNVVEYLEENLDTYYPLWRNQSSIINTIESNCPYFVSYSFGNYRVFDFFPVENLGMRGIWRSGSDILFNCVGYWYSSTYQNLAVYSVSNSLFVPSGSVAYRILLLNSSMLGIYSFPISSTIPNISLHSVYYYGNTFSVLAGSSQSTIWGQYYGNSYISAGELFFSSDINSYIHTENTAPVAPVYSDDERLKLYKLWSSQNGDSLVVDLSAFRSYTPAAAYEFSNIVITLTSNGVDTDYNLPLSSSTINNGWDNNSNLYTISTPVTDFTLSDTYDTYVSKVSFILDVSSPGGSGSTPYYISTNFPLDVHHSSVTPGAVPTPVYNNPTVKSDNDISQIVYYLNNTGINYSGEFLMMQGLPDIPVWANRYTETIFKMSNDSVENAGEFITEPSYNIVTGWTYNVIDIFDYFNSIIDNYDNVYDVFVFPVDYYRSYNDQLSVLYEDLGIQGYIVFFTNRYYNHQNSLNTVDILSVIQKDANNFVDFVEYLQVRLDDFENKSLDILNPLYDETTYIDDKLASILYAVNNIESYNDSSIVSLLTDIKGLLSSPANEIDTPQECIQLFEAHPDYFNELWGTPTRSTAVNNQFSGSEYVRADLVPAWWEGKTLTMIYILKNDGETSRFYNDILNGLFDSYENLIESDSSFNTFIDSLFKTGYDYTDSFYGHLFDLDYNPEDWEGGFSTNE